MTPTPIKRVPKPIRTIKSRIESGEIPVTEQEAPRPETLEQAGVSRFQEEIVEFDKKPVEDILKESESIDAKQVASEVLTWLEKNVENFIDNHAKMFHVPLDNLDVQVGTADGDLVDMTETKKLQDLYRAIPDDSDAIDISPTQEEFNNVLKFYEESLTDEQRASLEETVAYRDKLNVITESVHSMMRDNDDLMTKLADRMKYFYELFGFTDGNALIQEMRGLVDIISFEYEAFSVGVRLTKKSEDGQGNEVVKDYIVPEGFTVCVELSTKMEQRPTSVF